MRAEACRMAKKLAEENGGKPADYMKEAWKIVKAENKDNRENVTVTRKQRKLEEAKSKGLAGKVAGLGLLFFVNSGSALKVVGSYLIKKSVNKGKKGVKTGAKVASQDLNFLKAPKDKPSDVFGGVSGMFTKKPQGLDVPDGVKQYVKDTFRLR